MVGFSRQAFYQHTGRQRSAKQDVERVLNLVREVRADRQRMGGKKLYNLLQQGIKLKGIKMGQDSFFDLLSPDRLLIRKRKRKTMTTFSRHGFRKHPNLIKEPVVLHPNQVWVAGHQLSVDRSRLPVHILDYRRLFRADYGFAADDNLEAAHCREALDGPETDYEMNSEAN